ncbi:Gfo/Idh/MocA family protein [Bacillus mesophilum]|uniref:Gfo/Idh/MocA family oxidoreductase n=1 Tax=Bacillus mesophilum TaxID=1071718 RepID=A0A7V7V1K1_9BACI|nr:Gfo/Idh/MocA family oxidoreductase [Bacillus mesophilum]KAB2335717.1 Gfo/Idh/MocA family oxidoreductase [Bacillus mesophilum]
MLRIGIIGIGAIGERLLNTFLQHEEVEIAGLCDQNQERLNTLKSQLPDVSLYTDYQELLKDDKITLIYLAVPPKYHHQIALDIISTGKHLLCEKPLANSLAEAEEMANAAKNAGIVHAINFPMVYSNVFHLYNEKIQNGSIGELKKVEVNFQFTEWPRHWQQNDWIAGREQGGFIREVAPHYIQMLQYILGDLHVTASFPDYPEDPAKCETGFISRLETANGIPVLFSGISGIGQKEHLSCKVYGEKGTIDLVNWSILSESKKDTNSEVLEVSREKEYDLVYELIKSTKGEISLLVDFDEGVKVQSVLEDLLHQ